MRGFCNLLALFMITFATYGFADTFPGYLNSVYGKVIRGAYGQCVHTAYYDPSNGLAECGEAVAQPAPPPAPKPPKIVFETVTMSDADNVLFNFNIATLTTNGTLALSKFIDKIDHESDVTKITIDGYTDAIGKYDYNMKLSQDRANTVKQFFISKGFANNKITTTGYGSKDARVSDSCFAKYGQDPLDTIWGIQNKLASKKFKAKHLSKTMSHEKKALQAKLDKLQQQRNQLISCAAPDRRVVFTIEHTEQVEESAVIVPAKVSASAGSGSSQ